MYIKLTIGVLEALFFLGGLGDHFDTFTMEDANISAIAVEHFERQHKVFSLVRIRDEQCFGSAIVFAIEVELLHVLIGISDADEGTQLGALFRFTSP